MKIVLTTLLLSLTCTCVLAQQTAPAGSDEVIVPYKDESAAPYVIFSNLGPPDDRFNSNTFVNFPVAGRSASGETEGWAAVAFTPEVDVQAQELLAALSYISGTKLVTLGIYADDGFGNANLDDLSPELGNPVLGAKAAPPDCPTTGPAAGWQRLSCPLVVCHLMQERGIGWWLAQIMSMLPLSTVPGICPTARRMPTCNLHSIRILYSAAGLQHRFEALECVRVRKLR